MFKNIVLATDGSKHANKAADVAADIAARYGAKLTLVTALSRSMALSEIEAMPQAKKFSKSVKNDMLHFRKAVLGLEGESNYLSGSMVPAPNSAISALGDAILDAVEVKAKKKGVKAIKRAAIIGRPAEVIVAAAKKANADLIVVGTRGLSDIKGVLVGSVSHQVMHLAACPCLTVK
jgi:nucleotide-binding universal stress UspA family protein